SSQLHCIAGFRVPDSRASGSRLEVETQELGLHLEPEGKGRWRSKWRKLEVLKTEARCRAEVTLGTLTLCCFCSTIALTTFHSLRGGQVMSQEGAAVAVVEER